MAPVSFLPKLFRWVFAILAVLAGLGALAMCALLIINPHVPVGTHFGPTAISVGGQPGSIALRPDGNDFDLVATAFKGTITLALSQAGGLFEVLKHYGLPLLLLRMLFLVALFELLRRLFRNVGHGESFTPNTIRLVQLVGGLLILSSFVLGLAERTFSLEAFTYLASHTVLTVSGTAVRVPLPGYDVLGHARRFLLFGFLNDPLFYSGLLVLALSEVFRQGLALKKDSELTI